MTLSALDQRIQTYNFRQSSALKPKIEAYLEIKAEYTKRKKEDKISEEAQLSEIAKEIEQKYLKLYSVTKQQSLLAKIAACKTLELKVMSVEDIKTIISKFKLEDRTYEILKTKLSYYVSKRYITIGNFNKALESLKDN